MRIKNDTRIFQSICRTLVVLKRTETLVVDEVVIKSGGSILFTYLS